MKILVLTKNKNTLTLLLIFGLLALSSASISVENEFKINNLSNTTPSYTPIIDNFQNDTSVAPLFINGKVSVIYVAGLFCPYCAMETWSVVLALSLFGNFSGLSDIISSEGSVPTYNFVGSNYTSPTVDFQPVEIYGNTINGTSYGSLEQMNDLQNNLFSKYGTGSIPFQCYGGSIFRSGAGSGFDLNSFSGQTFTYVKNQVDQKNGQLYDEINQESNFLIQIVNSLITRYNSSTVTTTSNHITTPTTKAFLSSVGSFNFMLFLIQCIIVAFWRVKKKTKNY